MAASPDSPRLRRLFREIAEALPSWRPRAIFDVGANVGQSCTAYAAAFPDAAIHAFEPVPMAFGLLRDAAAPFPGIVTHNLALGSAPGTAVMTARRASSGNRILAAPPAAGEVVEVPVETGAAVAARLGVDAISFLKIDTEGHDLEVLKGFGPLLARTDFVQVEAGMNPENTLHVPFRTLEDLLRAAGFLLFRILDQSPEPGAAPRPLLYRCNPLFIHRSLALAGGAQGR